MKQIVPALVLVVALGGTSASAQGTEPDVRQLVDLVERGQGEEVKRDLPSLLARSPNNPGLLYVQGLVTEEGAEAVRIYQSVVDNFPRSEWADDALYKVYQFYYSLGLYRTAELKLNQLKKDYPSSKYLAGATGADTRGVPEEAQPQKPAGQVKTDVVPVAPVGGNFALQVGAYTAQTNADKQKKYFEDLGYMVEVISKVKDSRSLYTVLVGGYATYEEAKARAAEIKQKYNIDSFVISR
jgi:tetratricopeptide (TPR) repeat protein